MMPPDPTDTTSSAVGRPKRDAAKKAEVHLRRALALSGADAVPDNGSSSSGSNAPDACGKDMVLSKKPKSSLSCRDAPVAATATTAAAMAAAVEATEEVSAGDVSAPSTSIVKAPSIPQRRKRVASNDREGSARPGAGASRGTGQIGKAKNSTKDRQQSKPKRGNLKQGKDYAVDRPLKSAGRGGGGGSGRADPRVKGKAAGSVASVARLMERLSGFGTKVRVPSNATMFDVWKALDAVQANLPPTHRLTIDDLVGYASIRRSMTRTSAPGKSGFGCGQRFPRANSATTADNVQPGYDGVETRTRQTPWANTIDEEILRLEGRLWKVETKVTKKLQVVATKVEKFRSEPDSPQEVAWREWAAKILEEYEPLRIRIVAERAKANAKKDEQRRVEAKRQEEELMAVCYVCHSGDHSDEDSIVFCDRCCVAVHTSCYDAQG
eukprot:jgi/Undpi1/12407/HiC_scaffold_5.g02079.m1